MIKLIERSLFEEADVSCFRKNLQYDHASKIYIFAYPILSGNFNLR